MPNPHSLKALLIDLNGTVHLGKSPTRGAVEAIRKLRASRVPFVFCSNSTKESTAHLLTSLCDMGIQVKDRELMTSLGACREIVQQRKLNPFLLLSQSAKEEFETTTSDHNDAKAYDSVILGLDPPSLSYDSLNKAFRILKSEPIAHDSQPTEGKVSLIAPHASMFQQSPETDDMPAGLSLGIGPFVRAWETAAGVEAELVGKPTRRFFEMAVERIKEDNDVGELDVREVGVIGDDITNDLGDGARELGLKRFLVRTGKYRPSVEKKDASPDAIYDDFASFIDELVGDTA